jgi:hypothetical protein
MAIHSTPIAGHQSPKAAFRWPTAFFNIARGNAPGDESSQNVLADGHIQTHHILLNMALGQNGIQFNDQGRCPWL